VFSVRVKHWRKNRVVERMELTEQIAMVLIVFALLGGLLWMLKKRGMAALPLGFGTVRPSRRGHSPRGNPGASPAHAPARHPPGSRGGQSSAHRTAPSSCTILDGGPRGLPASLPQNILSQGQ